MDAKQHFKQVCWETWSDSGFLVNGGLAHAMVSNAIETMCGCDVPVAGEHDGDGIEYIFVDPKTAAGVCEKCKYRTPPAVWE